MKESKAKSRYEKENKNLVEKNVRYVRLAGWILIAISLVAAFKIGLKNWVLVIYIIGVFMLMTALYFKIKHLKQQVELAKMKKKKH
ncbi:MAG TPA: hypothetical protein VI894_03210 [Candidatus Nanoarchaeia archaeon]|nr:hypothetical protein [Candidatus Nanoarchaeia archaeon]